MRKNSICTFDPFRQFLISSCRKGVFMAEYTLKYINHQAKYNAKGFIEECEHRFDEQVNYVADLIVSASRSKPIVLLNGPSSSGKTTTCKRLSNALEVRGVHAHMISMDDYYRSRGSYEVPEDPENHVPDLESPECMNLPLLSQHLEALAAGEEISVPRFDFDAHVFIPDTRSLRLGPDEVVVIEGIHAFNPVIMGDLAHSASGVYLSVASSVQPEDGALVQGDMIRFLRRALRDSLFRSSPVECTINQWLSVRRGERLYIGPYRGQADMTIDTFLPYELNILSERLKFELKPFEEKLKESDLGPICELLPQVELVKYGDFIPEHSVIHEFIG